jgi:hypothetical protein
MKKCKGPCGQERPLTDFHKHRGRTDGYANECKECKGDAERARYAIKEKRVKKKSKPLKGKLHCERNGGKTIKRDDCLRGCSEACFTCPHVHDKSLKMCSDFISPEEAKATKYNDRVHNEVYPNHYLVI